LKLLFLLLKETIIYPGKLFDNDCTPLGNISHGYYYKRFIPLMSERFFQDKNN